MIDFTKLDCTHFYGKQMLKSLKGLARCTWPLIKVSTVKQNLWEWILAPNVFELYDEVPDIMFKGADNWKESSLILICQESRLSGVDGGHVILIKWVQLF